MKALSPTALYVCADPGVPVFGQKGCSVHVQEMLTAFRDEGLRMSLVAQKLGGEPSPDLKHTSVHLLPALPAGDQGARERAAFDANEAIRQAVGELGEGDPEFIYERYSLWSYAAMEYARDHGIPGILEVNAPLIDEQLAHRGLVNVAQCREVAQRVFSAASQLLAVSEELAAWLETQPGARGKVSVLPNAVNPERFRPEVTPARPRCEGDFVVGFLGTLKPWHGLGSLLEAFAGFDDELPRAQLLLVGDGPERESLEARASQLGISQRVHFTGAVAPETVPAWLASMDVAVAPYPPLESFYFSPLKLYEYLAAARPVIASRLGQISEVVKDGVSGLLVKPGCPMELRAALLRLAGDPELGKAMGLAGRDWVFTHRTWRAAARKVRALAERWKPSVTSWS